MSKHKTQQIDMYSSNVIDLGLDQLPDLARRHETLQDILEDGVCDQADAEAEQELLAVKAHIKAIWQEHNLV